MICSSGSIPPPPEKLLALTAVTFLTMNLGKQYLALNVKDLLRSKQFYELLGFKANPGFGGLEKKWLIMRNGEITIGLYQDIIPKNTITFNTADVRQLQRDLRKKGFQFILEADEYSFGPAHFLVIDPDGNPLFFEQSK